MPPKKYKVNVGDYFFTISLYSPDGKEERKLPVDETDFIAIELQLIAEPLARRL